MLQTLLNIQYSHIVICIASILKFKHIYIKIHMDDHKGKHSAKRLRICAKKWRPTFLQVELSMIFFFFVLTFSSCHWGIKKNKPASQLKTNSNDLDEGHIYFHRSFIKVRSEKTIPRRQHHPCLNVVVQKPQPSCLHANEVVGAIIAATLFIEVTIEKPNLPTSSLSPKRKRSKLISNIKILGMEKP